jgi:RNA polymerase sigma-70 factor, ECF subfamily
MMSPNLSSACDRITHDSDLSFEHHRRHLAATAYKTLGSTRDVDDILQDAWLRWEAVDHSSVRNQEAFLTTIVVRLALDRRRSRQRREWHVDPTKLQNLAASDTDPSAVLEREEAVADALQIVLQVMSPSERAVFLLHDIFGFRHAEVATILQRSESAVRQTVHRARVRARTREPRFSVSPKAHAELHQVFSQASGNAPTALADLARSDHASGGEFSVTLEGWLRRDSDTRPTPAC